MFENKTWNKTVEIIVGCMYTNSIYSMCYIKILTEKVTITLPLCERTWCNKEINIPTFSVPRGEQYSELII